MEIYSFLERGMGMAPKVEEEGNSTPGSFRQGSGGISTRGALKTEERKERVRKGPKSGLRGRRKKEEKVFADLKSQPSANTGSLTFPPPPLRVH